MARMVLMAEVSGGRVQGRPRLGWIDGVKVALGNSGMTVEAAWPFLLGPVFFRTTLPCSGDYYMEREEMPLHDAVGINCKKGRNY